MIVWGVIAALVAQATPSVVATPATPTRSVPAFSLPQPAESPPPIDANEPMMSAPDTPLPTSRTRMQAPASVPSRAPISAGGTAGTPPDVRRELDALRQLVEVQRRYILALEARLAEAGR